MQKMKVGVKEVKKRDTYVVWVNVAPYVRQYLLLNFHVSDSQYSDLVDIRHDAQLNALFTSKLAKPSYRRERELAASSANSRRSKRIPFLISREQFTRFGWALTLTDEATLNKVLEIRCKTILMTSLTSLYYVYGNLAQCIELFYRRFHFDDETWPTDTIRKIWLRKHNGVKKSIKNDLSARIDEIVLANLSKNGTISQKGLKVYENSRI